MPDLRDRLHALDALEVPDVMERARRIGPKTPMDLEPGPSPARRIAVAAFALLLTVLTIVYATRALRPTPTPPATPNPTPTGNAACAFATTDLRMPLGDAARSAARLVTGTSPDDLWAVASRNPWLHQRLYHYDGSSWSLVPLPKGVGAGLNGSVYGDLVAVAPDDLWMLTAGRVDRFDGTTWTGSVLPGLEGSDASTVELDDLEVIGPDDAWVAGNVYDVTTETWRPGLWHWDGSAWTESPFDTSARGAPERLVAVSAWGPDDVWAAGTAPAGSRGSRAVALHWDGISWSVRAVQGRRAAGIDSFGLVAVGRDDAMMTVRTGVVRWNGDGWTDTGFDAPSSIDVPLVMARGGGGVWAKVWNSAVARWDGATWRTEQLGRFYSYGMSIVGDDAVFAGTLSGRSNPNHQVAAIRAYGC